MLEASRDEALLAVDLYNQPRQPRRLEAFFVHMHISWLYLLQSKYRMEDRDIRYRLPNGHFDRVDGEPKTWDLTRCVAERWDEANAIRKNLELTISLRNKIEHRFHEAINIVASGYAQALLINYEEELVSIGGAQASLGEILRFPIFVGTVTPLGQARFDELRDSLPRSTRDFIARFESSLDPAIKDDQRYEFRIHLVPKTGSRESADRAISFVRESDLTDEQRSAFETLGRTGQVVVREQIRPVSGAGLMRPRFAAQKVQERITFKFHVGHFVRAWKKLGCRPLNGDAQPERTIERYCVYDEPHGDYLYTEAMIEKIVRETTTRSKFRAFLELEPEDRDNQ